MGRGRKKAEAVHAKAIERIKAGNRKVSPAIWELTRSLIERSVERGLYLDE